MFGNDNENRGFETETDSRSFVCKSMYDNEFDSDDDLDDLLFDANVNHEAEYSGFGEENEGMLIMLLGRHRGR